MAKLPVLLGSQQIFTPDWSISAALVIEGNEIRDYRKIPFPPAAPTFEIGPLGQVSQRQNNLATIPYRFEWELILNDIKKEQLEAIVSVQQYRYFQNNERSSLGVTFDDERFATLELLEYSRKVRTESLRFDTNPTSKSQWQFSRFIIKFEEFTQERNSPDSWLIVMSAVESKLDLENTIES